MSICAPRCNSIDVVGITGSTLSSNAIDAFIQPASLIIDSIATCASTLGVTDEAMASAEYWLAAHLIEVSNVGQANGTGIKTKETFENYSVEWAMSKATGQGIMGTSYGMTANALTRGCLIEADKRNSAVAFVGGAS